MSTASLTELMERWKAQHYAQLRHWQGFRLPQRSIATKSRKVQRTLLQGIYPRGKAAAQLIWMHRNAKHYV